ncbi:hypothetical protein [Vallitalea guaymasensis]|uniref:Uncharacterized protein n=1 Tax=Vallitalea guaymasensis TaxID=1185412 RepID=A0A8J8SE80_9FIRM|nr:hypothetical protein [Vallitalea guaymasensis]QUH31597.1 hypothetical protein HYG85_22770 [Vallitalea guaymasensis]
MNLHSKKIDVSEIVSIGCIKQHIMVRGNPQNPIILFIHGGLVYLIVVYQIVFRKKLNRIF